MYYRLFEPRHWFYAGFIAFVIKLAGFVNVFIGFLSPDIGFIKVLLLYCFGSSMSIFLSIPY
jgi:hypothetical protein